VQAQVAQGHFADAHATLDRYAKASPQSPSLKGFRAALAMVEGKYASADTILRQIRKEQRNSRYFFSTATGFLAGLEERQGRLGAARRYILEDIQGAEAAQDYREAVEETALLAAKELLYGAKPATALAAIDSILQRHPLASMDPMDRPYGALALAYANGGRVAEARKLLTEMDARVPAGVRRLDRPGPVVYGVVAEAEGKDREALAAYMRWNQVNGACVVCGLYESALVYDRLGKPDSALALLEQIATTRTVQKTLFVDSYALAPSLKRLGELYETKGDKKKAAEYYTRFVDLWKNADPELQPAVRDVRTRLARLSQEPGT
jgi:tetratricopeptide (TPR) repeat protein